MSTPLSQEEKIQRGAEDAGRHFRSMLEFVGFTPEDGRAIRQSALVIEKHIPAIVADFYTNLLSYPPTRAHFLRADGSLDEDYLQKRMNHLSHFWRRTAAGEYDDEYARYVDYVGRAHTSHGADPNIYIAERYVIGQVGFMQHAISSALRKELHGFDDELEARATQAWNKLMMVLLEMMARAYQSEHEAEGQEQGRSQVDAEDMRAMAVEAYEQGLGLVRARPLQDVVVASVTEIPEGERKIVQVGDLSIGIFHQPDGWYALRNHCLHRGGPVATGPLEDGVLVCPWHGYRYEVSSGRLLSDRRVMLEMYPLQLVGDDVHIAVPAPEERVIRREKPLTVEHTEEVRPAPNEFNTADLLPGQSLLLNVQGEDVAVFNVGGRFYATQNACTHAGGPLHEGRLSGARVECPWHGSRFDVTSGEVLAGPADDPLRIYRVSVDENGRGRVELTEGG